MVVGEGGSVQCKFCPGQSFRRSRLHFYDLIRFLIMRYPVRCLECGRRQTKSFAVARVSVPSHVNHRRAQRELQQKHWTTK